MLQSSFFINKTSINSNTEVQTIEYANELMKYKCAHYYNLEKYGDKNYILVFMFIYTQLINLKVLSI